MIKQLHIPLGSQHAALLEPLRLDFSTENERIVSVRSDMGYVHRGVEHACMNRFDYKKVPFVVARVCGLCAITHSSAAVLATEALLECEISDRAQWLRMLALEFDRIHSHMLCLAHVAESSGYEALFMRTMMERERVMEAQEILSGNRVQFDYATLGGVTRDMDSQVAQALLKKLHQLRGVFANLRDRFEKNWSTRMRYEGVGTITAEQVHRLGAVGPIARAAGVRTDIRIETDHLPYHALDFEPIVAQGGDLYARNRLRLDEIDQSMVLIERILEGLPEGAHLTKVRGKPKGEAIARIEAPRGELFYYVRGNGEMIFERLRIRTPTYANLKAFEAIFLHQEYSSIPAILASLDPCMSCTAK